MRLVSMILFAAMLALPLAARAQSPVVVELFTSQGCSSCPPADTLLGELSKRDGVIALSLHVDYWDYLGWKDVFASPQNTRRQRGYSHARGSMSVYTPQVVVQGLGQGVGSRRNDVEKLIAAGEKQSSHVVLSASRTGRNIEIRVSSGPQDSEPWVIQLVEYSPLEQVEVKRGENAGRTLSYYNVVRKWTEVATWDGQSDVVIQARSKTDLPVVVIVQAKESGPILAALKLD
jgi:hypothetical protein